MEDHWYETDTTPSRIDEALRRMLAARHQKSDAYVPARVLNLVVIVEREFRGEIENRLERVGRYHPSRLIVCSVSERQTTLDASARIGTESTEGEEPDASHLVVGRERVGLYIGPKHLQALDTIVDPLLIPDLTTLVWAPHGHQEGVDSLRRLVQSVLIDSQDQPALPAALARAEDLAGSAYVVDLAWLRSTPWRERVAAAFDPPPLRAALPRISAVTVRHRDDSLAAAVLFCGWLTSRLGWKPGSLSSSSGRLIGHARGKRQEVRMQLEATHQDAPGLAGVTIEMASGETVSLDRAPGGLRSVRRSRDGREQVWTVLGASRGEGGILGEGVRQALLRDPTYTPSLRCAKTMVS